MSDVHIDAFVVKNLPGSEVELTGEIPFSEIESHKEEALKHVTEHLELPGFRKGHVPSDIALKKVGEIAVLEEAVEHYMSGFYPKLVLDKKLDPVGRPSIVITKLAPGNPVGITIRTAVFPTFTLPEYKKLAGNVASTPVEAPTEEEVTTSIDSIRRMHAKAPDTTAEGEAATEAPLPELTDEFVRTLGPFENVAEFKEKLKTHITSEKERQSKEKRRVAITEAILEKTEMDIPRIFVESEVEKMLGQMREDVKRFGMTFEDYIKRVEKTEETLRAEFQDEGRKRAKLQLLLNAIAEKEEVKVPAEDIEKEAKHILDHFKDADRERVHIYVESMLRNEKVLSLLEEQK